MEQQTITLLPSKWLTPEETEEALGKSKRTVQEMAQNGLLKWKTVPRPGTTPGRVYDARDVQKHVPTAPRPEGVSQPHRREPQRLLGAPQAAPAVDPAIVQIETERWKLEREERERQLLRQKGWLKPSECSRLEGLPSAIIVELAESGKLVGIRCGRGWRISRVSLEGFTG